MLLELDGHLLHPFKCIFEELRVYFTPAVEPAVVEAFSLAAVAAQGIPAAGAAFFRNRKRFVQKISFLVAHKQTLEGIVLDIAQFPLIQRIEIAGIYAAVAFDDKAWAAATDHRTVFRRHAHEHGNPVVKVADGNGMPSQICLMIAVERGFQEREIDVCIQGISALFAVKPIQTGDELRK